MLLQNVCIVGDKDSNPKDIFFEDGMISSVTVSNTHPANISTSQIIRFDNAIAFPGLINSHDHLDFNLFPQLGNKVYNSYREWGADIHQQNKSAIQKVLAIPKPLRVKWGMYKNLLNGFTTVVNHGELLNIEEPFITVFQNTNTIHSVGFEKKWKWKLNKPAFNNFSYVTHCGEGTDLMAHEEINALIKWNIFKKALVAVHGVAMDPLQVKSFKALVWCPSSNFFLLDKTAEIDLLKKNTSVIFGTDSTLTADWNSWNHLRMARETKLLYDDELISAVTDKPAQVWGMYSKGIIKEGYSADIVIARKKENESVTDSFFQLNPADILLVVQNGKIKMFDSCLYKQMKNTFPNSDSFSKISILDNTKHVTGDLSELIKSIRQYYPDIDLPFSNSSTI